MGQLDAGRRVDELSSGDKGTLPEGSGRSLAGSGGPGSGGNSISSAEEWNCWRSTRGEQIGRPSLSRRHKGFGPAGGGHCCASCATSAPPNAGRGCWATSRRNKLLAGRGHCCRCWSFFAVGGFACPARDPAAESAEVSRGRLGASVWRPATVVGAIIFNPAPASGPARACLVNK